MAALYQSSEAENRARDRLYENSRDLREALLDLLSIVRASNDPWPAQTLEIRSEPSRLRREAEQIERRDAIIHRARRIIDGTKDAEKLTGSQLT